MADKKYFVNNGAVNLGPWTMNVIIEKVNLADLKATDQLCVSVDNDEWMMVCQHAEFIAHFEKSKPIKKPNAAQVASTALKATQAIMVKPLVHTHPTPLVAPAAISPVSATPVVTSVPTPTPIIAPIATDTGNINESKADGKAAVAPASFLVGEVVSEPTPEMIVSAVSPVKVEFEEVSFENVEMELALPHQALPQIALPATAAVVETDLTVAQWFILKGKNRFGPFMYVDVIRMLQEKSVFEFDYVWAQGVDKWRRIAEVPVFSAEHIRALFGGDAEEKELFFRRNFPRARYETSLICHDNNKVWKGKTIEISEGGAGVIIENALILPGQNVYLHFKAGPFSKAFNALSEVVSKQFMTGLRDNDAPVLYGIKFININKQDRESIRLIHVAA